MAINASERFERLPKARRDRIAARTNELIAEVMTLANPREPRLRSQAQIAERKAGH
jgi:hypothetical protein